MPYSTPVVCGVLYPALTQQWRGGSSKGAEAKRLEGRCSCLFPREPQHEPTVSPVWCLALCSLACRQTAKQGRAERAQPWHWCSIRSHGPAPTSPLSQACPPTLPSHRTRPDAISLGTLITTQTKSMCTCTHLCTRSYAFSRGLTGRRSLSAGGCTASGVSGCTCTPGSAGSGSVSWPCSWGCSAERDGRV